MMSDKGIEGLIMAKKLTRAQAAEHYRDYCSMFGMTQLGMGRFLGISPRQSRRFAAGVVPLPQSIELLLQIMRKHKITPEQAFEIAKLKVPREGFADRREIADAAE